jgi:hypothetical protein
MLWGGAESNWASSHSRRRELPIIGTLGQVTNGSQLGLPLRSDRNGQACDTSQLQLVHRCKILNREEESGYRDCLGLGIMV